MSKDPMAMQRLREAAEKAKIELSSSLQVGFVRGIELSTCFKKDKKKKKKNCLKISSPEDVWVGGYSLDLSGDNIINYEV